MSDYKRVLKHLNKEELATQKVELALIQDIQKAETASSDIIKSSFGLADFANKIVKQRNALLSDLNGQLKEANNIFDKSAAILSKAQDASEKLGMSTNDVKGYNDLEKTLNVLARSIDSIIRAKKALS